MGNGCKSCKADNFLTKLSCVTCTWDSSGEQAGDPVTQQPSQRRISIQGQGDRLDSQLPTRFLCWLVEPDKHHLKHECFHLDKSISPKLEPEGWLHKGALQFLGDELNLMQNFSENKEAQEKES